MSIPRINHFSVKIGFSDEHHASVHMSPRPRYFGSEISNNELFSDLFLFGCYTLRQFRNLGNSPEANALAKILNEWSPELVGSTFCIPLPNNGGYLVQDKHVLFYAALDIGLDIERAEAKYGNNIYLIQSIAKPRKSFEGKIEIDRSGGYSFRLYPKGFGFLGKGIPTYAPDSVMHFLAFLIVLYENEDGFLKSLQQLIRSCSAAFKNDTISMLNQEELAWAFATKAISQISTA